VAEDLVPKMAMFDHIGKKIKNEYKLVEQTEPLLFYIYNSIEVDVFLTLAKLLDGNRSDKNILKFISFCESNRKKITWKSGIMPHSVIEEHKRLIKEFENTISIIKIRRDKYLAHSDKEYFLDSKKLNKDYPIRNLEMIEIIKCFQKILGDHTMGLNNSAAISVDGFFYIATDNFLNKICKVNPAT